MLYGGTHLAYGSAVKRFRRVGPGKTRWPWRHRARRFASCWRTITRSRERGFGPSSNGMEVFRLVRERSPETKILVFSGYMSDELIVQCLQAGAKGYLAKTAKSGDLVSAIKVVNSGGVWAEQRMMAKALEKSPTVTKRELDIIRLVSEGLRN